MKKYLLIFLVIFTASFLLAVGPTSTYDSNVEQVDITGDLATSISHTGCPGVIGVEDLTAQSVNLTKLSSYSLSVTFGTCGGNYGGAGEVWIDWDQSGTFETNESIGQSSGTPGTTPWDAPVVFTFTVPDTASFGSTTMRVMQRESGSNPLDPEGSYSWGSVMDFGIGIPLAGSPEPPTNPSPADAAIDVAIASADLTWDWGAYTDTYDLWFGPAGAMVLEESGLTVVGASGSWTYPQLTVATTYNWQLILHNGTRLDADGPVWSFTTPIPADNVDIDIYCGTPSGYGSEMDWSIEQGGIVIIPEIETISYVSGVLYEYSVYLNPGDYDFVAVDTYGDGWNNGGYFSVEPYSGTSIIEQAVPGAGVTVPFTVADPNAPGSPVNPDPADLEYSVILGPTLTWTNGANTDFNAVYFSTDITLVENLDVSARVRYDGTTAYTTYTPPTLAVGTAYYWRVLSSNSLRAELAGPVWTFYTLPGVNALPFTEGFESGLADWSFNSAAISSDFHGGEFSAYWTNFEDAWMTAEFAATSTPQEMSMWLFGGTYGSQPVTVEIKPNGGSWILLSTLPTSSTWTQHSVFTGAIDLSGGTWELRIIGLASSSLFAFAYIDDISIADMTEALFVVEPNPHAFGNVLFGAPATQNFVVTNNGISGTLTATIISGTNSAEFALANLPTFPLVVPAGGSTNFDVIYTPTISGAVTANLEVVDDVARVTHIIPLTGTGVDYAIYTMTPSTKDFGMVSVGHVSEIETFTIENTGYASFSLTSTGLAGTNPLEFNLIDSNTYPVTLNSGESIELTVQYDPTAIGSASATITMSDDITRVDHIITLYGEAYGLNEPTSLEALSGDGIVDLSWVAPVAEGHRRDNGIVGGTIWVGDPSTTDQMMSVQYAAGITGTLDEIAIYHTSDGVDAWGSIMICPDDGGQPDLTSPLETFTGITVPSELTWLILTPSTTINLAAGDIFYIVTQWPTGNLVGPAIAYSTTDTGGDYCNWTGDGGATWNSYYSYEWFMRAFMSPPARSYGDLVATGDVLPDIKTSTIQGRSNGTETSQKAQTLIRENSRDIFASYTVKRGIATGVYTDEFTGVATEMYQDGTVTNGVPYFYVVSAVYDAGESVNSNEVTVTPSGTPPGEVAFLTPIDTAIDQPVLETFTWEAEPSATGYKLQYGLTSTPDLSWTNVDCGFVTSYTLTTDLLYNTTYYWRVVPYNATGDAVVLAVWSFTTRTDPTIIAPFTEAFDVYPPADWRESAGLLADPTVFSSTTSSSWTADGFGNVGYTGSARVNIWSTTSDEWMFTPPIDIGTGNAFFLSFDIALTPYASTSPATLGVDDIVAVLISQDGTWSSADILQVWNSTTPISNTGDYYEIDLSSYSGVIELAFYGESTVSNTDNDLFIDNVAVRTTGTGNDILTYSFAEQTGPATIDDVAKTVDIETAYGTDVTGLIATFGLSPYASAFIEDGTRVEVEQESGTTANDFTSPIDYIVYAEDGSAPVTWTVTVTVLATPLLSVVPDTYDFGTVWVTQCSGTQTFTIDNVGADSIQIVTVAITGTDAADFSLTDLNTLPIWVSPAITVDVDFCPLTAGVKTANLVVTDNLSRAVTNIPLTGTATALITAGGPDTFGYTWANDLDLSGPAYSWITPTPVASTPINITISAIQNGPDADVIISWDAVAGATSYTVYRTDDPNATFPGDWTAQTGIIGTSWSYTSHSPIRFFQVTAVGPSDNMHPLLGDDNVIGPYPIGFSFDFYGTAYSEFYVCSNGFIGFGTQTSTSYSNYGIPTLTVPNNMIAWFWDDLDPADNPNGDTYVYYENLSGTNDMLISFIHYHEYSGGGTGELTAQIILHTNGDITLQYDELIGGIDVNGSTVGIENLAGDDGLEVLFNGSNPAVVDDRAIKFIHPVTDNGVNSYQPSGKTPHEIVRDEKISRNN